VECTLDANEFLHRIWPSAAGKKLTLAMGTWNWPLESLLILVLRELKLGCGKSGSVCERSGGISR
jgi:hypothetical protein